MPHKGYIWTAEDIQKRADANRGKKRSDESKQRMREAQLKYNRIPGVIEEKSKRSIEQWNDPIARELARQRAIKQMSNPKAREHLRNINLGKKASEETKRKMSESGSISQKDAKLRQIQSDAHKGCKSHLWKGGITPLALDVRHSHKMRMWKDAIFSRDKFTCVKCSKTGVYFNAHHIIKFSKLMKNYNIKSIQQAEECKELWDINNGITLCKECHKKIHTPIL